MLDVFHFESVNYVERIPVAAACGKATYIQLCPFTRGTGLVQYQQAGELTLKGCSGICYRSVDKIVLFD